MITGGRKGLAEWSEQEVAKSWDINDAYILI
jgi:hypothetical protein